MSQLGLFGDMPPGQFRWSLSRARRLETCDVQYYLQYVRSGSAYDDALKAELVVLKSLRNRFMWVGQVVHEQIELALRRLYEDLPVDVDELVERGIRRMRAGYLDSVQGRYRSEPYRRIGFLEHEYHIGVSKKEWWERREQMERCLRYFFEQETVQRLRSLPRWRWASIEGHGRIILDGISVIARPDFVFRDEDEALVIVDWKTGKARPEAERLQLSLYALHAQGAFGFGAQTPRGLAVHLNTGEETVFELEDETLNSAKRYARDSIARMKAMNEEAADKLIGPSVASSCEYCSFRKICPHEKNVFCQHKTSPLGVL